MKYLPHVTDVKNEIVFYLGVLLTIIAAVIEIIEGWDVDSVTSWMTLAPAIWGVIQRNFAYGPLTVARDFAPRDEMA